MNNRCLIQSGKPPVDYLMTRRNRFARARNSLPCEIYTIVPPGASNPVARVLHAIGYREIHSAALRKLQRRSGTDFKHRVLVGWPRIERERDINRQRPEWRFPADAESERRLQLGDIQRILKQERLSRVAQYHAA